MFCLTLQPPPLKEIQWIKHIKTQSTALTCFKAYDVRGELGVNFDAAVAYRIGRAVAQHFQAANIVVGYDARETSPDLAAAVMRGICDAGSNVMSIGLAGTEEMYWAVTENSVIDQQGYRHVTHRTKGRIPCRGIWDTIFTGHKGHAEGIAADR